MLASRRGTKTGRVVDSQKVVYSIFGFRAWQMMLGVPNIPKVIVLILCFDVETFF